MDNYESYNSLSSQAFRGLAEAEGDVFKKKMVYRVLQDVLPEKWHQRLQKEVLGLETTEFASKNALPSNAAYMTEDPRLTQLSSNCKGPLAEKNTNKTKAAAAKGKSAGVKKLEKVNTKGMASLTSFFKKK
ncbi:hypothetical protein HDV05_004526 [Chytridiales sp. JEL 0842]|nr:hypothetical protein HDV05_004526 [Chytridiales sp. JEL 0842]